MNIFMLLKLFIIAYMEEILSRLFNNKNYYCFIKYEFKVNIEECGSA